MKKFALFGILMAFATMLRADVLYWQVDPTESSAAYTGTDVAYAGLYSFATDPGVAGKPTSASDGVTEVDFAQAVDGKVKPLPSDIGDGSSLSFFVELFNESGQTIYTSAASSYQELVNAGFVSTGGMGQPTILATGPLNGAAVPEPTSGVLLLMGGALLALRRRREA